MLQRPLGNEYVFVQLLYASVCVNVPGTVDNLPALPIVMAPRIICSFVFSIVLAFIA
jgi:hypothetical protein